MKKILSSLIVLLLVLTGCTAKQEEAVEPVESIEPMISELSILSPTGAPGLSLLDVSGENKVTFVDGADLLQAAFVNPTPEYDIIIAPSNLGAKLANAGKTTYKMLAVVTWGNLYILGSNAEDLQDENKNLAVFGEGAVPGLVFEALKEQMGIKANVTYYASVTEAQTQLLSGKADLALIAEPAATATVAKAKENNKELTIIADLQSEWENKTGSKGYPQASLFVESNRYSENKASFDYVTNLIAESITKYTNDQNSVIEAVDAIGAETLGVPNSNIISKTYTRLGIKYANASEVKEELKTFLSLFGIEETNYIQE